MRIKKKKKKCMAPGTLFHFPPIYLWFAWHTKPNALEFVSNSTILLKIYASCLNRLINIDVWLTKARRLS